MLEQFNEEIRRQTRVARFIPNAVSCMRLILALVAETHDHWISGQRCLTGEIGLIPVGKTYAESWSKAA